MVKTEVVRDYYADLELAPTADANEIKRQFKKLALKYHPDRNPGKELEFNSKFQSIQSANEVLTDPQQRAKYDAKRMQSGLLHTYMDKNPTPPPRPPPRSPTFKYPPPPRPPPPSATKPTFSPPPTGSQKYARFNKPDAPNAWNSSSASDARSKTNDFKAWEQMRHGQGPIPPKRATPAKQQTFESGRGSAAGWASNGTAFKNSMPRRSPWEHLSDAGMPKTNSARVPPRKAGFAPGDSSSTTDELPPRSAYAYVSRTERPGAARSYTSMAPPPVHVSTAKKPDPVHSDFKPQTGPKDTLGAGKRTSAPYHTGGGEKTFTNPILQRSSTSASPRDGHKRPGWHDSDTLKVNESHARASSAGSNHQHKDPEISGLQSSSSSSSSSSDDGQRTSNLPQRQKQIPRSRRTRMPAGSRQRSFFTPNVAVEDAEDESMAPHESLYTGPRRHSGIEIPTSRSNIDPPEGFAEHRAKHETKLETEHSQRSPTSAPASAAPDKINGLPRVISRPKSFDESYKSTLNANSVAATGSDEKDKTPMYSAHEYFPFLSVHVSGPPNSRKWPDQWPFHSHQRSRALIARVPPYWAIPSTLSPVKETHCFRKPDASLPFHDNSMSAICSNANNGPFYSFQLHPGNTSRASAAPPPLRSQSSDTINISFSPSGAQPPSFGVEKNRFPPPPCDHSRVWASHSPDKTHFLPKKDQNGQEAQSGTPKIVEGASSDTIPFSPVSEKYSSYDWNHKFSAGTFQFPQNGLSGRTASRKRAGAGRPSSLNNLKRPGAMRTAGQQQAPINMADKSQEGDASTNESFGTSTATSQTSSDGSAMDIDPVNTPPSATDTHHQPNEGSVPAAGTGDMPATPRQGPSLPPRPKGHPLATGESNDIGLGGLSSVAPFAPVTGGLNAVDDLRASLPFQSRASPTRPESDSTPERSDLPKPPKAPSPPVTLTQATFHRYAADMTNYMSLWNKFYTIILLHFQARCRDQKTMNPQWVSNVGGDYDSYLKAIEEDEKVMKYWEVAQEHHRDCIRTLGVVREKAMKSIGGT